MPPTADLPDGRWLELPGRGSTFVTEVTGPPDAPTVILLHAWTCTAQLNWFPALRSLGEHYRVLAFDQRWHGRGICSDRFRLTDCADDVIAVAEAYGVDTPVVAGYSLGGLVAQLTWQRHRDAVGGLVLCTTTATFRVTASEDAFLKLLDLAASPVESFAARRVGKHSQQLEERPQSPDDCGSVSSWAWSQFRATSGWSRLAALAEIGRFDSTSWLGAIDVPTAVVVTTRDKAIPPERQRAVAHRIPGASLHEVDAGHASCFFRASKFVPGLLDACESVMSRLSDVRRGPPRHPSA